MIRSSIRRKFLKLFLCCLQKVLPETFRRDGDIFHLPYLTSLPEEVRISQRNKMSLEEIFQGFFSWFLGLKWSQDVPSVRTGQVLRLAECQKYSKTISPSNNMWSRVSKQVPVPQIAV